MTGVPCHVGEPGSQPGIGDGSTPAARPAPPCAARSNAQNAVPAVPGSGPGIAELPGEPDRGDVLEAHPAGDARR